MSQLTNEIYLDLQRRIAELHGLKARLENDIVTTEQNLVAMKKELETTDASITRFQGGMSLIYTLNGNNIILSEGQGIDLNQPNVALQQPTLPAQPTQPQSASQQAVPTPQVQAQPQQPLTQQGIEQFTPQQPPIGINRLPNQQNS